MAKHSKISGRAKTVLVFGEGQEARAVVSTVVARVCEGGSHQRLRFTGRVAFEALASRHIIEMLLPMVDRIRAGLGLQLCDIEVAMVNLAAASAADVGTRVSGFSADVSVLLALVSAGLQMAVPEDLVCTGHVASPDGDIRAVKSLPSKLTAAAADRSIRRFVYPVLDPDLSLPTLSPNEYRCAVEALTSARDRLKLIAVKDVSQLVKVVFDDETIVLAALRQGFFQIAAEDAPSSDPIGCALQFLNRGNEGRFSSALQRRLLAGQSGEGQELLTARIDFHLRQHTYPHGLGHQLLPLVQSLPPAIRRLRRLFPLLPMRHCIEVSQHAGQTDYDDVKQLIEAVSGGRGRASIAEFGKSLPAGCPADSISALEVILSEIEATHLTRTIGLPIDTARASYVMNAVTVDSHEEFHDTVSAFHLHLLRHVRGGCLPEEPDALSAEALALLERAFSKRGGLEAALAEAREGTHGGLRSVLDAMTEQYKAEEQAKHIDRIFKEALDPLDWDARVMLMAALLQRLAPDLPEDIRSAPPERFARRWEILVRAYVNSLDKMRDVLRTL